MDREPKKSAAEGEKPPAVQDTDRPVQKPTDSLHGNVGAEKKYHSLAANLARVGAQLHELRTGGYLIAVGGTCRHFDSFKECDEFFAHLRAGA